MSTTASYPLRSLTAVHQPDPDSKRDEPDQKAQLLLSPSPSNPVQYDPFLFLAEDWIRKPSGGFPTHPHHGFETVTYVIDGSVEHMDSNGKHGVLNAGDVQYMTAGKGIMHSEMPHDDVFAHVTQLWLNLPMKHRKTRSRYQDIRPAVTPTVTPSAGVRVRVIIGSYDGVKSPAETFIDVNMLELRMEAGAQWAAHWPRAHFAFFNVIAGVARVGEDERTVRKDNVGILRPDEGEGEGTLRFTCEKPLHLVLYHAMPIGEKVVHRGPFVASNEAELKAVFQEYHSGRFARPE